MAKSVLSADHFHDEAAALAFIEERIWPNGPVCPHCGEASRVGRLNAKGFKIGMCKCYACRKKFAVTVGTVMESSHIPLHVWLQGMHLMCSSKKGFSANKLHRILGITLKSAWFLGHRIRAAMTDLGIEPMGGAGEYVEADETFIGRKSTSRAYDPPAKKQAVLALVQRRGKVRSFHVPNVTAANIRPIIAKHIHTDSSFQTDESNIYGSYWMTFADRGVVNHSAKEYVLGTDYTNTVEGFFSILKRGIYGIYQHVSEAHLHRYLAEFDFRYSHRIKTGFNDTEWMEKALTGIAGKRLTYRSTGGSRAAQVAS
jgi:transposase-like protein